MPSIYLKQTDGSYTTGSGTVNVTPEAYPPSNLFTRYKHEFTSSGTGKIYIYKGTGIWSGAFIITRGSTHTSAELKEAHVYFNQYDTKHENPLLFVLIFNGGSTADNKYYKWSQFNGRFTGGQSVGINTLSRYQADKDILDDLIKENDQLKDLLTYNIGKTSGDNGDNGKYNAGKICVEDDTTHGVPKLESTGFRRYKHTPAGSGNGKKACVIFDKNVLMGIRQSELKDIQNQQYDSIVVYMGTRAKKKSATNGPEQIDVPLLIELTKTSTSGDQPEYYIHKKSNLGGGIKYYWEPLPGLGGMALGDLLEDMGFGMEKGDNGYNELKQLLLTASVDGVGDDEDLSTKVGEVKGKTLQGLLSQKVGQQPGDSGSQKLFLQLLLTQIEFDLLDSIVILLEKNTTTTYDEIEVSGVVGGLIPPKEINTIDMSGNNIKVSDETSGTNGQCVKDFGYKLISHNISEFVKYTLTLAY